MNTLLSDLLTEVETRGSGAQARACLVSYLGGQRAVVEIDGDLLVARCLATLGDVVLATRGLRAPRAKGHPGRATGTRRKGPRT